LTVPVEALPPITSVGLTVTADSFAVDEDGGGGGELAVQPESVTIAGLPDPSSTATRQSDGRENGSRSILKFPPPSLVPIATSFTVIVRVGAAVPSNRSRVPESSAREIRTVASADGIARMLRPKASETKARGRRTPCIIPATPLRWGADTDPPRSVVPTPVSNVRGPEPKPETRVPRWLRACITGEG